MATNGNNTIYADVLIIGAGPTGLALSQGLKKAGLKAVVFDKVTEARLASYDRDWNMGIHWGQDALNQLLPPELVGKLQTTQTDPNLVPTDDDCLPMLNAETGDTMLRVPTGKFVRYTRSKFLNLLKTDVEVQYGKELVDVHFDGTDGPVTASFADGSSAVAKLLVGADGARSAVRRFLLGDKAEPNRLPYTAVWTQFNGFTREEALKARSWNPLHIAGIHPKGMFSFHGMQDVLSTDKPEDWKFFFYISWPTSFEWQEETKSWTNEQWLNEVQSRAKDYCQPWATDFGKLTAEHPLWHIYMSDWDPSLEGHRWDNHDGRITLAGDACHSITFQRGQGLNHSLTDAKNLHTSILSFFKDGTSTQGQAVTIYEDEMIERTGTEVRLCTNNTHMLHDWSKVQQSPVFTRGTAQAEVQTEDDKKFLRKVFLDPAKKAPLETTKPQAQINVAEVGPVN